MKKKLNNLLYFIQKNRVLSFLILCASIATLLITIPSGSHYCYQHICGDFFWGSHGYDGTWHLTLINNSFNSMPFLHPLYSGSHLIGYNYLLDLILSIFSFSHLSASFLYFKVLPFIWLALMFAALFRISTFLKKSYIFLCALIFFVIFGSTAEFLLTFFHTGVPFEAVSYGSILTLTNMQYSFSLVTLLFIIDQLLRMEHELNSGHTLKKRRIAIFILLNALIVSLKFYGGVIIGVMETVFLLSLALKWRKKGSIAKQCLLLILATGGAMILSILATYSPSTSLQYAEPVFSMKPFAHVHAFLEDRERLYLPKIFLARYSLLEHGIGPRLILIEIFSIVAFLVFQFGARIIGAFYLLRGFVKKSLTLLDVSLLSGILTGILAMLLLVQRGQWWNSIQFFYYSLFLSSFFCAEAIDMLFQLKKTQFNRILITFIIFGCIIFTLPFNIGTLKNFTSLKNASYISDYDLEALSFLKTQKNGVVATFMPTTANITFDKVQKPSPLYAQNAPYVSAYSHKIDYVTSEALMDITGVDYTHRKKQLFEKNSSIFADIDYAYVFNTKENRAYFSEKNMTKLKKRASFKTSLIFENPQIRIYEIMH